MSSTTPLIPARRTRVFSPRSRTTRPVVPGTARPLAGRILGTGPRSPIRARRAAASSASRAAMCGLRLTSSSRVAGDLWVLQIADPPKPEGRCCCECDRGCTEPLAGAVAMGAHDRIDPVARSQTLATVNAAAAIVSVTRAGSRSMPPRPRPLRSRYGVTAGSWKSYTSRPSPCVRRVVQCRSPVSTGRRRRRA